MTKQRADTEAKEMVCKLIKSRLKSLGFTQASLAKELGVSHPSLKRWLAGKGLGIDELTMLMVKLDLEWDDFAAETAMTRSFHYTLEQEEHFALVPEDLAYFDLLLRGYRPAQIRRMGRLDESQSWQKLRILERLGLIEIISSRKLRLTVSGEPVWRKNGPLARNFRHLAIHEFLKHNEKLARFALLRCLERDRCRLQLAVEDLFALASSADRRARLSPERSRGFGLLLGFADYEWSKLQLSQLND